MGLNLIVIDTWIAYFYYENLAVKINLLPLIIAAPLRVNLS